MFPRGRVGLPVVALLGAALGLSACFPAPPPPPPPPPPAPPPPSQSTAVACQGTVGDPPLVTVEATPEGPEITSTPIDSQAEADAVVAEAAADGDLISAEFDVRVHIDGVDEFRDQQWALNKVPYEDAWPTTTGTGQVVAVVDSGVSVGHPDLAGQLLSGHHFLSSHDGKTAFYGTGQTDDDNGHGTHVAGIIAALANNTTGIAGTAPGVKILPVKVLCADGGGWAADVAEGIKWAANNGADVINLSLGSSSPSPAELAAVNHARSKGAVVVAAAGNEKLKGNGPNYPAFYDQVIAVGATTNTSGNARASYSNTGTYLDLAAPGGESAPNDPLTKVLSTWNNGGYASIAGTSMATPHVSAAAALVRAAQGFTDPKAVCEQLVRTAQDLGQIGHDTEYGYGLVRPDVAVGLPLPVTGVTTTCV